MPTLFEYFGFVFKFYSNEQEPIHVHVQKGGCEVVFEIIEKWIDFFVLKKKIKKINIKK